MRLRSRVRDALIFDEEEPHDGSGECQVLVLGRILQRLRAPECCLSPHSSQDDCFASTLVFARRLGMVLAFRRTKTLCA